MIFRILGGVWYETGGNCDLHSWDINEEVEVKNLNEAINEAREIAKEYLDRYGYCSCFNGKIDLYRCYKNSMKKVYRVWFVPQPDKVKGSNITIVPPKIAEKRIK